MRRAGSLLLLLLLLSLSACTAEANNKEGLGDNAVSLTGRRWHLRGRRAMAARGHGEATRDEAAGAKNTGANPARQTGISCSAHASGSKRPSSWWPRRPRGGHRHGGHGGDAATMASDMLRMDYSVSVSVDVHSRRPINNDAPLDELADQRP
ncbi:hypothetical protein D1007_14229 [Hordeum vulgare]|nr:hypothetical protein D1007_14229 [Hordeum vulgare]